MKIYKRTNSKKKFIKKLYPLVDEVVERVYKKPKVKKVIFFFTDNPKKAFLDMANPERIPHGRQYGKLEKWLSEGISSFSIQDKDTAIIMINNRDPVLKNKKAAKALIAHEFMHTIEKSYGMEPKISRVGGKQWPLIIKTIQDIGKDYENVLNDLIKLTTFFILCMKDIIVNEKLIESGFEEELLEWHKYFKPQKISKVNRRNLADVIISYVGYKTSWIPFEVKMGMKIKYESMLPKNIERECNKILKELKDINTKKFPDRDISEVVKTGLDVYRRLYKKLK